MKQNSGTIMDNKKKPFILGLCVGWLIVFLFLQITRSDLSIFNDTISQYFSGTHNGMMVFAYVLLILAIIRLMYIERNGMGKLWHATMIIVAFSIAVSTFTGPFLREGGAIINWIHYLFGILSFIPIIIGQWLYSKKRKYWTICFPIFQLLIFILYMLFFRHMIDKAVLEKLSMLSIIFWAIFICF